MTPEQIAEAERASALFHTALASLGLQAVTDSLSLWDDVPPLVNVSNTAAVAKWLAAATRYVMSRRLRARDMALSYYRYQRALTTGTTVALPGQDNPPYMTLPELKRQFESYLDPADADEDAPADDTDAQEADVPEADRIPVEALDGIEDELDALEAEAEQQVRDNLIVLGPLNQDRKTRGTLDAETPEEADAARVEANKKAGNRQAAAAARNVMNGARGSVFLIGDRDRKVLGFVRVSRTGTPCGFCAMLISRGPVMKGSDRQASLYRSGEGTGPKADGTIVTYGDLDLYHDNCQCYAVPVFALSQFGSGEIFALNREYAALWDKHIKDQYSGDEALTEWRRLIRQRAKSQKSLEAAA
jgi:hypothetical protein